MTVYLPYHNYALKLSRLLQDKFVYELTKGYLKKNRNYEMVQTNMDGSCMFDALFKQLDIRGKYSKDYNAYR